MDNINYTTDKNAIKRLAETIMASDAGAGAGKATYLRSLTAAVQEALAGKVVLRVTGRAKRHGTDEALAAFEAAQKLFYEAVLEALPDKLDAAEKQSRTSFARSAAATLRRALRTGWNPLSVSLSSVSKGLLAAWSREHSEPRAPTPARAEKRVLSLAARINQAIEGLPRVEATRLLDLAHSEIGGTTSGTARPPAAVSQRISGMRIAQH